VLVLADKPCDYRKQVVGVEDEVASFSNCIPAPLIAPAVQDSRDGIHGFLRLEDVDGRQRRVREVIPDILATVVNRERPADVGIREFFRPVVGYGTVFECDVVLVW